MGAMAEAESGLRWLVLDLNSFFASCEQQERPALRGKRVAVVPMMAETTCVIAASYPAKAFGIKTGTPVWEARKLCPQILFVPARPKLYVAYHHRILTVIEEILPIDDVMSIDEVACRLDRVQGQSEAAHAVGLRLKRAIETKVGCCLTSSVGIGPNKLLAKLASNMRKPDGLTLLPTAALPAALLPLPVQALPGIGPQMRARLAQAGIVSMEDLWAADAQFLRRVWGGLGGLRFHALLHGADMPSPARRRSSIGHQHVLAPEERSWPQAWGIVRQLLIRAAERLRREGLFCQLVGLEIKGMQELGSYTAEQSVQETQDTALLLRVLATLWAGAPRHKPLRVGIVLGGLREAATHQLDLFERPAPAQLTQAVDRLNSKFGSGTVAFGASLPELTAKIAFQRVPDTKEF